MATARMTQVVDQLRKAALAPGTVALSDGRLLEAFVNRRDEGAFETLVRRHGPMVLGVCRRVLRDRDDADDAFQATFLVLIRKASAVAPREMVGNWLYGVAYRTAQAARVAGARRRAKEKAVGRREAEHDDAESDWLPLLDRELNGLPTRYRAAVVLCELEGKSRREAARLLSIPEGTLSSRLATARRLLARRLSGKGIVLTTAAIATALAQREADARVPVPLLRGTLQLARTMTTDGIAAAGMVSAPVMTLAEGVVKGMLLAKLKVGAGLVLLLTVLGLGAGIGGYHAWAGEEPAVLIGGLKNPAAFGMGPDLNEGNYTITIGPLPKKQAATSELENKLSAQPLPRPALVILSADLKYARISFKQFVYQPVTEYTGEGKALTTYRRDSVTQAWAFPLAKIRIYDAKGVDLTSKPLPKRFQEGSLALVYWPGQALDPLHLPFIKEGTLIFAPPRLESITDNHGTPLPPAPAEPPLEPQIVAPPATAQLRAESITIIPDPPATVGLPPAPPLAAPPTSIHFQPPVVTPPKSGDARSGSSEALQLREATVKKLEDQIRRLTEENQRLRHQVQPSAPATYQINARNFRIPTAFSQPLPPDSKVAIFVSNDEGKTWKIAAETTIRDFGGFEFRAPTDGMYWFNVQLLSKDEKASPAKMQNVPPMLKVRVNIPKNVAPPPAAKPDDPDALSKLPYIGRLFTPPPAAKPGAHDDANTKFQQAAERNARIAEFYRRTGHLDTAAFYDQLAHCGKVPG